MAERSGGIGKVLLIIIIIALIAGALFVFWVVAARIGIVIGPSALKAEIAAKNDQIDHLEQQNEDLQNQNDELKKNQEGISGVFLAVAACASLIFALVFLMLQGDHGGNITREQFVQISKKWIEADHNLVWYADNWGKSNVYRRIQSQGLQAQGCPQGVYIYFVEFAKDFAEGGDVAAGGQCITYWGLSNDHERSSGFEIGLNLVETVAKHKAKILVSSKPDQLFEELKAIEQQLDVVDKVRRAREETE